MGRLEGDEGVMEVDRQTVASFNAAVMGYAIGQKIEIWTDKASQNSGITRNTSIQRAMEVV
jgi:hypothetical protein